MAHVGTGVALAALVLLVGCARGRQAEGVAPDWTGLGGARSPDLGRGTGGQAGSSTSPNADGGNSLPSSTDGATGPDDAVVTPPNEDPVDAAMPMPDPPKPDAQTVEVARPPDGAVQDVARMPVDIGPMTTPPFAPNLARGRVAHWQLDETAGNVAHDSCGVNNHGAIVGIPAGEWRRGRINNALQFVASQRSYVEVPAHETLRPPRMISIALCVRPQSWQGRPILLQKGPADEQFSLFVDQGQLRFLIRLIDAPQPVVVLSTPAPALDQWSHVAVVYDGDRALLFVDGVPVAVATVQGLPAGSNSNLTIGGRPGANDGDFFNGTLDDVVIYTRLLSLEEIALFATGRSP